MPHALPDWSLLPIGLVVGLFGTLIGAGGGFILVPALLILEPEMPPDQVAALSLAVVFFNAASGSYAYAKMKRVDFKSAIWFSLATLPGAVLGALTTKFIPRLVYQVGFGVLLLGMAAFLIARPEPKAKVEGEGVVRSSLSKLRLGVLLSLGVGYVSSLLGIGGGIIHVPLLVHALEFPVHTATATSHMVLAVSALAGTVTNALQGHLDQVVAQVAWGAVGVIAGAQIGARLSNRVHGAAIVRSLGVALALVAVRLLLGAR